MALQHLHLHVRDRCVAERFYEAWFGMGMQRRGSAISFMTDDRGFLLALMSDPMPAPLPPWFHFGFCQDSAAAVLLLHEQMLMSGVAIGKPLYQDDSLVSYRCVDPDGDLIEVFWEAKRAR